MSVTRRDFIKLSGGAIAALGLSKLRAVESLAAGVSDVEVYAFKCGILKTRTEKILKDTRVGVPMDIPVPFFLIRHGASWVAFDTGNNAKVATEPVKYWGEVLVKAYTPVMDPSEEFKVQIKKLGLTPKDISCVIISHGHLDHAGAIEDFRGTNVPIYIQKAEIGAIKKGVAAGRNSGYIPEDFKYMDELNVKPLEGVFDIFGDRTVVAFPTPGHTPGHQSVLVNTGAPKSWIFASDACYTLENMAASIPIGFYWDLDQAMQALYIFKVMHFTGDRIIPMHDPAFWSARPLAPEKLAF
jgi:N-acyl homoserine lactone hydrolase